MKYLMACICSGLLVCSAVAEEKIIRLGMIGLDTSHVPAFAKILNDPANPKHVPGAKVVAGFKGGSADIPSSADRVEGFTKQLEEEFSAKIYDSIEELCQNVDAVLLMSVDGRPHLDQARRVIAAGLPLFIDKPVAGSLKDAIEIFRLAKEAKVPVWSSSSLRFYPGVVAVAEADAGEVRGAISYGPANIEKSHPDLFWYGVHPTESLFTVLGTGCVSVTRVHTDNTDVVTGTWDDGKVGVLYGMRNQKVGYKVIKFGAAGIVEQKEGGDYAPLVKEIVTFFQTGKAPVSAETTIEMFAFMEAADESKRRGGAPVSIAEVIEKAAK